jgi:hypothetical protein
MSLDFIDSKIIRSEIESSDLIDRIYDYVKNPDSLDYLGSGTANKHYRLGQTQEGLWLATRELTLAVFGDNQRAIVEDYCENLNYKRTELGLRISKTCLPVRTPHPSSNPGLAKYFLIVEDFTRGGTSDFKPAPLGEMCGTLDGEDIYYDFDNINPPKPEKFIYTSKGNILELELEKLSD